MKIKKKAVVKIFQIVSLGEEVASRDIKDVLVNSITINPKKPNAFFTVTDCTEANN